MDSTPGRSLQCSNGGHRECGGIIPNAYMGGTPVYCNCWCHKGGAVVPLRRRPPRRGGGLALEENLREEERPLVAHAM